MTPSVVFGEDVGDVRRFLQSQQGPLPRNYAKWRVLDTRSRRTAFPACRRRRMTGLRRSWKVMNMGFMCSAFNQISTTWDACATPAAGNYTNPHGACEARRRGAASSGRESPPPTGSAWMAYFQRHVPGIKIVAVGAPHQRKGLMRPPSATTPRALLRACCAYNLSEELPEGDYICALGPGGGGCAGSRDVHDPHLLAAMRHNCLKGRQQREAEGRRCGS